MSIRPAGRLAFSLAGGMASVLLIFICLIAGLILGRTKKLPLSASANLNTFITHISLPALTLVQLHNVHLHPDMFFFVCTPWIVLGIAAAWFGLMSRWLNWDRKILGALILCGGFGNTSFLGFPLLEAIFGPESLKTGILIDQLGSFLALSTAGILLASFFASHATRPKTLIRRLFSFPPFLALIIALFFPERWMHPFLLAGLERLASTLVPLALVSVGLQLRVNTKGFKKYAQPLFVGLSFKLIIAPLLIFILILSGILKIRGEIAQVTVVEAAMAPMITSSVLAAEYGLEPELVSLLLVIGILMSFLSVPIWSVIVQSL